MQSSCAHHVPHYTVQALRARGKRAVVLPLAFGLPAIVAGWTRCATSTASVAAASTATAVRHQRRRQALRRQRCTARRIDGCDKHCEYNDAQPDRFSHGRRDRDVLYARTIVNAHHASYAFMQPPFPSPPLPLPLRYLLVRASFANKENSTARGWGLGA